MKYSARFHIFQPFFIVTSPVLKAVMVYLTRLEHFNAAHKLYNPAWSKEKNEAVFGKCANENWHGHNFNLYVTVKGNPDKDSGFVMDAKHLSRLIKEHVTEKLDHKNLNLDTEEFSQLNPTAENIAMVIYRLLRAHIDTRLDLQVRLYETERNFVDYPV